MEKAVGEELKNTPTVIVKTGIFDNIDKLYGTGKAPAGTPALGGEEAGAPTELGGAFAGGDLGGGEVPAPPGGELGGGEPPTPPPGEITPESTKNRDMNILLESDMYSKKWLDLGVGQQSLGKIEEELNKLLNS